MPLVTTLIQALAPIFVSHCSEIVIILTLYTLIVIAMNKISTLLILVIYDDKEGVKLMLKVKGIRKIRTVVAMGIRSVNLRVKLHSERSEDKKSWNSYVGVGRIEAFPHT